MIDKEYKYLTKLGLPVVIGQLGIMIQGVIDTIMLGHYSTVALASAGFVNSLFTLVSVIVMGLSFAILPLCGSAYGRNDTAECGRVLKNGLFAVFLFSIVGMAVMMLLFANVHVLKQPEELIPSILKYFWWTIPSMVFVAVSSAFKSFFDSITQTKVAMWAILIGNVWNVIWNFLLIFGLCGFPELGVVGAAIATLTSRFVILLIYVAGLIFHRSFRPYLQAFLQSRLSRTDVVEIFRMGLPTSVQCGLEVSSFSICTIFVGWLGTNAQAAQQIMINLSAIIWVVYNGIGMAVGVRVSNFLGMKNYAGIRHASLCGIKMILCCAVVLNLLFYVFHMQIFAWFTSDGEITLLLVSLIMPIILYQFGDALQTNFVNVLRGLGCVRYLMLDAFIAYMVVSLPLSYTLAIPCGFGLVGIWMGFPFGLSTAAALYIWRYRKAVGSEKINVME
ncbi:MAG: MATE family efflux transporter [Prevotella sp.]|nr:MATE family efflux transporter [Prevotella sp.]